MKKARRGFTLLETLIYAVLISMTIGFILFSVYGIIESRYRSLARIEIEEETNFLMRKITWALSGISAINQPPSGATSTTLSVNKIGWSPNPIVFSVVSSSMTIAYGSGPATVLHSEGVLVKDVIFEHVGSSSNPGVRVGLTVEFVPRGLTAYNATSSVHTTIYARKQ